MPQLNNDVLDIIAIKAAPDTKVELRKVNNYFKNTVLSYARMNGNLFLEYLKLYSKINNTLTLLKKNNRYTLSIVIKDENITFMKYNRSKGSNINIGEFNYSEKSNFKLSEIIKKSQLEYVNEVFNTIITIELKDDGQTQIGLRPFNIINDTFIKKWSDYIATHRYHHRISFTPY